MTERKPAARKPAARKSVTKKAEAADELKHLEQEVEVVVDDASLDELGGKTVQELRIMHDKAIVAESEAKRLVHILRQRAANLATNSDIKIEEEVIAAKKELAKAEQRLREVEKALENEFKDIYGEKF